MHPDVILLEASETYREKSLEYGDNFKMIGPILKDLFPRGVNLNSSGDNLRFHLVNMLVMKITRYCVNFEGGGHQDSLTDLAVYAAMLQHVDAEAKANEGVPF